MMREVPVNHGPHKAASQVQLLVPQLTTMGDRLMASRLAGTVLT